jgi:hypothetical protein
LYVAEFQFRYNNRENVDIFGTAIQRNVELRAKITFCCWSASNTRILWLAGDFDFTTTPKIHKRKQGGAASKYEPGPLAPFRILALNGLKTITKYCNSYPEKEKKNWPQTYYCDLKITDVYIALFSGFLVIVTGGIVWVGFQQYQDTRILQRAFISVKPLGVNPFISEKGSIPDKIVGHVAFINVGRLPARNVSVERACMEWKESNDLQEADLPITTPIRPMNIVLSPGTEMRHGTNSLPVSDLEREPKPGYLYVWGKLTYTDGFGVHRQTRFCHRYPCRRHKFVAQGKSISRKHARYHRSGNDAD